MTGVKLNPPDDMYGDRFNHWGVTIFRDGSPPVNERFETEDAADTAKETVERHITGFSTVTTHQRWDTLKKV